MFDSELRGMYKREQYEDFAREAMRSQPRRARRASISVLLLTGACLMLGLVVAGNELLFQILAKTLR